MAQKLIPRARVRTGEFCKNVPGVCSTSVFEKVLSAYYTIWILKRAEFSRVKTCMLYFYLVSVLYIFRTWEYRFILRAVSN